MLSFLWWIITLPIRLLAWIVVQLGRLATMILGFILMVAGVAFSAGGIQILGIPLFVVGLILTVKAFQ